MTDQVASLVVEVDASGAKKAAVDLDSLTKAADRADNAANDLADSSRKLSAAEQTVANEAKRAMVGTDGLARAQRDYAGAVSAALGPTNALLKSIEEQSSSLVALKAAEIATAEALRQQEAAANAAASAAKRLADEQRKAERAAEDLASRAAGLKATFDPVGAAIDRANAQLAEADDLFRQGAISAELYERSTSSLKGQLEGLSNGQANAAKSSKSLQYATLNLGRQFSDIGVSLSSGMNPLMVLVQQGPQIGEIFATLKTEGVGAGAAFQAMGAALAPALPLILGIGAAVGVVVGAFALFERAVDKETKHATTFGDTWKATLKVTGDYIMDGPIGDGLKWLGKAFNTTLDFIVDGVTGWYDRTVGLFIAAYKTITTHWKDLPAAFGAIMIGAANGVISGIQFIVDGALGAVNYFRKKAGMDEFARVELPKLTQANNAAARDFEKFWTEATANVGKAREGYFNDIVKQTDKEFEKRQKAKKATEDHAKAVLANNDAYRASEDALTGYLAKLNEEIATMGMSAEAVRRREAEQMAALASTPQLAEFVRALAKMYEDQARVGKEAAEVQKAVGAAANDNIKTFGALGVAIPTAMERAATEMDRVSALSKDVAWGVEDIADAINRNDWTSAFVNLARVLSQVQNAFKTGADSATKFAAAAGLAQGVGAVVGGSTGSAISGTASGALAGFQLGGPVGAVIGGGIGLVTSLFGSSKAKKQQRAQEAAQRAAEEAARQQQISDTTFSLNVALLEAQGKAEEALAMTRQRELDALAKLDPSLVALQKQLFDLEDVANATAKAAEEQARWAAEAAKAQADQQKITLDLMALDDAVTGGNSAVLAARQLELATLDPASRALKEIYFSRIDEGEALAKQAAAAEAAAKAQDEAAQAAFDMAQAYQTTNIGLMRQLMALDDAANGGTSARDAGRTDELAKLDATGKALQTIIWARQDEAEAMAKQAAAAETLAAQQAEVARVAAEFQATNIGLMRQLMAMDDAVLGTTSARDAMRADELAKLDATGKYLQQIIWARQDEADRIAKQTEAMEAAAARAKELASRQGSIQDQIDQLTLSSSDLLLKTRAKERAEAVAFDASLGPLLDSLYSLQDAAKATEEANKAAAAAAEQAARVTSARLSIQDRIDQITLSASDLLAKKRAQERAETVALDASLGPLLASLYALEDAAAATAAANEAAAETQRLASEAASLAAEQAQRAAEVYASRMGKLTELLEVSGRSSESVLIRRAQELASIVDPVSRALQLQIYQAQDLAGQISAARNTLSAAYEREGGAIEAFRDKLMSVGDSLRSYSASLGATLAGSASPAAQRSQAEQAFRDAVTRYQQGDVSVAGQLPALGDAFAKASQAASKDQLSYLRDIAYIRAETDQAASKVDAQVTVAQAQLDQLKAQVRGLIEVKEETTSVVQAVTSLTELIRQTTYGQDDRAAAILAQINGMQSPLSLIWSALGSKAALAAGLPQYNGANDNMPGFATGGSFMVGGSGGADSQHVQMRLTPGEIVNVSREDSMAALVNEIRGLRADNAAMRQELSAMRSDAARTARATEKSANTLTRVTRDGDSLITEAA